MRTFIYFLLLVFFTKNQEGTLDLGPAQNSLSQQQHAAQKSYQTQQNQRQNLNNYQSDGTQSITNAKSAEQKSKFSQVAKIVQKGTFYQDYMFSVEGGQQFVIKVQFDQQIAFYMFLYAQTDSTFARIGDVSQQPPLRVHIYENNDHLIVNQMFFFLKYIVFDGKSGMNYSIRFYSSGRRKFVAMNMKVLKQNNNIIQSMGESKAFQYSEQTANITKQMIGITGAFNRHYTISGHYMTSVVKQTKKYYVGLIAEILVGCIVSYIQIKMILKLLKGNSII